MAVTTCQVHCASIKGATGASRRWERTCKIYSPFEAAGCVLLALTHAPRAHTHRLIYSSDNGGPSGEAASGHSANNWYCFVSFAIGCRVYTSASLCALAHAPTSLPVCALAHAPTSLPVCAALHCTHPHIAYLDHLLKGCVPLYLQCQQ